MPQIKNPNREVWEGWTVKAFIEDLEPCFDMIMNGESWRKPFASKGEIAEWCTDNQPFYKKRIPEVVQYFCAKAGIK